MKLDLPDLVVPKKASTDGLRIKEVRLSEGLIPGFDVEWTGKTGNQTKYFLEDYDGIRFIGEGADATHVVPLSSWDSTIFIGPTAKRVEFQHLTIHGGPRKAVHYGLENLPLNGQPFVPLTLVFNDFGIVADEPDAGEWVQTASLGNTSVWGVFGYNAAVFMARGTIQWKRGAEHAIYAHGISSPGILLDSMDFQGSGAECIKIATRPGEAFWAPGTLLIQDSQFHDWNQPWSWRGGCGIGAIQGGGVNIIVLRCLVVGGPGSAKSRCFMVDDGGEGRFYSAIDGTPGVGPANGWILLEDTALVGDGLESWGILARVGTLSPWANIEQARGIAVVRCGLYGLLNALPVKLELGQVENILIEDCNTPDIRSSLDAIVPIGDEAFVTGKATGSFLVSKGYRSGFFVKPEPA